MYFAKSIHQLETLSEESSDEYSEDEGAHVIHMVQGTDGSKCEDSEEEAQRLINVVTCEDKWWESVKIGDSKVRIQLDTGAKWSLMPSQLYKSLSPRPKLMATKQRFQSYTKHKITVKGVVTVPGRLLDTLTTWTFKCLSSVVLYSESCDGYIRQFTNMWITLPRRFQLALYDAIVPSHPQCLWLPLGGSSGTSRPLTHGVVSRAQFYYISLFMETMRSLYQCSEMFIEWMIFAKYTRT